MSKDPKASYYDAGGIETIDIIKAKCTPEEFRGYLKGCSIKYLSRMSFKHATTDQQARDAEKTAIYSRMLSEAMGADSQKKAD